MLVLATGIALYGFSFLLRGLEAFPAPLLPSFRLRPLAVWTHVLCGSVALVAGALNFRHALRRRSPAVHRRVGLVYVLSALASGMAGGLLAGFAYGGPLNQLGFAGLALATLLFTARAYRTALNRDFAAHRRWMVRSYAMIFAAVTLRIELPLLAVGFRAFDPAYAIVAWSCWVPNLLIAEWLLRRRPAPPI
jgi:uncharacterized membrane protein